MSTDSHGHGPQGSSDAAVPWTSDPDPAKPAPPPPVHAGVRRRPRPDDGRQRPKPPARRRRKARRVHRVVHHLDIWSVAKVASIFVLCGYVITLISGFILWRAADRVGTIDGIEGFMEDTGGYDVFVLRGNIVFTSALLVGAVLSALAICLIVLAAILFNLISDLTGGVRMTVIDEDLIVTPARRGARPLMPDPPPAGDVTGGGGNGVDEPTVTDTTPADDVTPDPPTADAAGTAAARPAPPPPGPSPSVEIDFG